MKEPATARVGERATWGIERWAMVGSELVTVTALLASLASIRPLRAAPAGRELLPGGSGPRDAYVACARFVEGGATPGRRVSPGAPPAIAAWQWTRLDDGRLRVVGYTDSRSPLGEPHRTYYQCDLAQLETGRWRLDSLAVSPGRPM